MANLKRTLPYYIQIPYEDPSILFQKVSSQSWAILLDSADSNQQSDDTNRFSYIVYDPFETIVIKKGVRVETGDAVPHPFQYLKKVLSSYLLGQHSNLPPFQGGAVGYFSYDLCHYLEDIPKPVQKETHAYADLAVGLYHTIVSFDHVLQKAWIVASGFPKKSGPEQQDKARADALQCYVLLSQHKNPKINTSLASFNTNLLSPFNQQSYAKLVENAQSHILEGDIFQINLSHRFQAVTHKGHIPTYELYLNMRRCNPSPFSAYLNLGDHHILSTSPERFLLVNNGLVSTRPIKGTTARGITAVEDKRLADALLLSEKNRSENIMIVDVLRNDLSKSCEASSVHVKKLCGIETYPSVHHLVSIIEGKLRPERTALDLLEDCFPGGSITGAPKVKAMQLIYELEPTARGPYCGSIGYIGYNGSMDTSIIIRTVLSEGNTISYQAGGAVVLDSSPEEEYEETLTKSLSIIKVLSELRQ